MKINQEVVTFKPITIVLETQEEAVLLWEIMDQHCSHTLHTEDSWQLACEISNTFSCGEVSV